MLPVGVTTMNGSRNASSIGLISPDFVKLQQNIEEIRGKFHILIAFSVENSGNMVESPLQQVVFLQSAVCARRGKP